MTLTDQQKDRVREWVAGGATLNEIQDRLREECEVSLTFMDTRLLLIDLDLTLIEPKSDEPEPPAAPPAPEDAEEDGGFEEDEAEGEPGSGGGQVRLELDELTLPGAIASGKATFSDGKTISWVLDQMGRLSLPGAEPGYQPPPADVPAFQRELQGALRRRGY